MKTFAEKLREARELTGMNQQEVADLIKKSLQTYQRYEKGLFEPKARELKILNDLFKLSEENKVYSVEEFGGIILQTNAIASVTLDAIAELLCASSKKSFAEVRSSLEAAVKQRMEVK